MLFSKPKYKGTKISLHIDGMHCVSCSLNIDSELEDLPGVYSSTTSYAKSKTTIDYDPTKVTQAKMISTIRKLGYQVE